MQNLGGALIVLVGAFFLVVGLKGTQHAALPSLFPASSPTVIGSQQTTGPGNPAAGLPPNLPIYQN